MVLVQPFVQVYIVIVGQQQIGDMDSITAGRQ